MRSPLALAGVAGGAAGLTALAVAAHRTLLALDEPLADLVRRQHWLEVLRPLDALGSEQRGAVLAVAAGALLWRRCRSLAVAVPATVLGTIGLNVAIKLLVDRPRPPDPVTGTALASFPSGHVLHAVVLLGLVPPVVHALTRRRWAFWLATGLVTPLVLCVAALRVELGAHWPTDVVGSLLIGSLVLAGAEGLVSRGWRCAGTSCAIHPPMPAPLAP